MEVARAWHAGIVYPHWVQDANYGAGEPRLIFYPPASWLLGALLGVVTSWHAAPVLFVLLALLASGGSMYLLAREWAPAGPGDLCRLSLHRQSLCDVRGLRALGLWRAAGRRLASFDGAVRAQEKWVHCAARPDGGCSMADEFPRRGGGQLSTGNARSGHVDSGGKAWPALRAAGGMALGLGLAAFYIVPAAFEQRWVQIERAITPGMRVEDSFLFAHTANAFHDQVLHTASWILVLEFAVASVAAYLAWKKRAGGPARIVITADSPGHSVAAIAGQRGDLEVHAAHEVSAVSLALADGAERGWLRLAAMATVRQTRGRVLVAGCPDRRHGHRRGPALLPALR